MFLLIWLKVHLFLVPLTFREAGRSTISTCLATSCHHLQTAFPSLIISNNCWTKNVPIMAPKPPRDILKWKCPSVYTPPAFPSCTISLSNSPFPIMDWHIHSATHTITMQVDGVQHSVTTSRVKRDLHHAFLWDQDLAKNVYSDWYENLIGPPNYRFHKPTQTHTDSITSLVNWNR